MLNFKEWYELLSKEAAEKVYRLCRGCFIFDPNSDTGIAKPTMSYNEIFNVINDYDYEDEYMVNDMFELFEQWRDNARVGDYSTFMLGLSHTHLKDEVCKNIMLSINKDVLYNMLIHYNKNLLATILIHDADFTSFSDELKYIDVEVRASEYILGKGL